MPYAQRSELPARGPASHYVSWCFDAIAILSQEFHLYCGVQLAKYELH